MAGRIKGSKNVTDSRPFKIALALEAKLAEDGEETPAKEGSLRYIARKLLDRAGKDTNSAKEVADRVDGKVPQALIGDDDAPPIMVDAIVRTIVHANNPDS